MAENIDDPFAEEAAPAPPPKKKSLFTKSLWNNPAKPAEQKEGIDFFSRAEEMWPERLAEEKRKRQKKLVKLERKRSTVSAERKPSSTPDSKRRRVSKEEPERHSSEGSVNHDDPVEASWTRRESTLSTPGSRKSYSSSSRQKPQASPTSLAERYSRDLHAKNKEPSVVATKGYISLSDSDNEAGDVQGISNGAPQPISLDEDDDVLPVAPKPVPVEVDPDMSDEEFPDLAREAREREQRKAMECLKAGRSFENKNHDTNGSNTPDYPVDDVFQERPSGLEDPMVEIFVSSVIEGTNPLIVRRKLSQKLREVRLVWCDKQSISGQPFPKSIKDSIFLTWRGKKLFDMTSCKSLGLKLDGAGQLYSDADGVLDGKVHFEAWTQDLFEQNQRRLAAKKLDDEDEPEEAKEDPVVEIRVTLMAKGKKELKLKVRPTTPIQKFITVFRHKEDIPEDKVITLRFDDEELDPESTVKDTGIEDRDVIEVHVR